MNEAARWVWEHSRAHGSARVTLMVLAEWSTDCTARARMAELAHEARISRRQVFRDVENLENLGELERRTEVLDGRRVTRFHLLGWHSAKQNGLSACQCPHFYCKLPDLRKQISLCPKPQLSTGLLTDSDFWHAYCTGPKLGGEFRLRP